MNTLKRFYATVNIRGIDRVKLLQGLWNNAKPAAAFYMNGIKPPEHFCKVAAKSALESGNRVSYFQGRAIKINFTARDTIENSYYVKYWGKKAFKRAMHFAKN